MPGGERRISSINAVTHPHRPAGDFQLSDWELQRFTHRRESSYDVFEARDVDIDGTCHSKMTPLEAASLECEWLWYSLNTIGHVFCKPLRCWRASNSKISHCRVLKVKWPKWPKTTIAGAQYRAPWTPRHALPAAAAPWKYRFSLTKIQICQEFSNER